MGGDDEHERRGRQGLDVGVDLLRVLHVRALGHRIQDVGVQQDHAHVEGHADEEAEDDGEDVLCHGGSPWRPA